MLLALPHLRRLALALLAGTAVLAGCKKDDADPEIPGLTGTWKLTRRDCYCPIGPVPDETITFTAGSFSRHEKGVLTANGSYQSTTAPIDCGSLKRVPVVQLNATVGNSHVVVATVSPTSLVLDYKPDGGGCISDTSVDTYERVQ